MRLLIAVILIHGLNLSWWWYLIAVAVWGFGIAIDLVKDESTRM